jgi:hypothetical protein
MTGYSSDSGAKLKNCLVKYHRAICPVEEGGFSLDSCQALQLLQKKNKFYQSREELHVANAKKATSVARGRLEPHCDQWNRP